MHWSYVFLKLIDINIWQSSLVQWMICQCLPQFAPLCWLKVVVSTSFLCQSCPSLVVNCAFRTLLFYKHGVLWQIGLYEIVAGILLICQNTTMWVYGAWIERCCVLHVLCSKTYMAMSNLLKSPLVRDMGARICETRLLVSYPAIESLQLPSRSGAITADTWRNNNAMIAPKRHRFDALMMISLRQVSDDWILSAYSQFSGFGTTEITTIPKQIKHHWDWGCTHYISRYSSSVKN